MPPKKKLMTYSEETLIKALPEIRTGQSATVVSRKYDIPRSTLIYKFTGQSPVECRMGPVPILGFEVESMLTNWIQGMAVRGLPIYEFGPFVSKW